VGRAGDEFVDMLTAKSDGNFMHLVHVLCDIGGGALTAANVDDIRKDAAGPQGLQRPSSTTSAKMPQGLKDYYGRTGTTCAAPHQEQFRRYR
jgi:hypothetical protein